MTRHFQAIYENGLLRPLQPLDLPENKVVDIDVRDISTEDSDKEKWLADSRDWMANLNPDTPILTDEQISSENIYEEQILRRL